MQITDPGKSTFEQTYHYYDIVTWSGAKDTFTMEYGNLMSPERVTFSGPEAAGIDALINVYMTTFYH